MSETQRVNAQLTDGDLLGWKPAAAAARVEQSPHSTFAPRTLRAATNVRSSLWRVKSRSRSRSVQRYGDSDLAKPLTSAHAIDLIKQV